MRVFDTLIALCDTVGLTSPALVNGGQHTMTTLPPKQEDSRYAPVRQYSLVQILAVWAAAALPMGVLAWVVAPLVAGQLDGPAPLIRTLLALLTVGLIWQFVLVMVLVYRERGSLRWSVLKDPLWLHSPRRAPKPDASAAGSGSSSFRSCCCSPPRVPSLFSV